MPMTEVDDPSQVHGIRLLSTSFLETRFLFVHLIFYNLPVS